MAFSKFNQKRFQKPIPVKEGDTYDVTIENIGEKGDGIAKVKGYVIIIPNTQKGERVKIKVNAIRGKVSFGEVIERLGEATEEEAETTKMTEETDDEEDMEASTDDSDEEDEDSDEEPIEDAEEEV